MKIYQLQNREADYWFMDYDWAQAHGFNLEDYKCVWEENNDNESLDDIFTRFNINHPEGYRGHSLSVSDIVELKGEKFYCDTFGWKKVE